MKEKTKEYIVKMLKRQIENKKREIKRRRKNIGIHEQYKNDHHKVFGCTYEEHIEWLDEQDNKDKEMIQSLEEMIKEIEQE